MSLLSLIYNLTFVSDVKKAFCYYAGGDTFYRSTNSLSKITLSKELLRGEGFSTPGNGISVSPSEIYLHALTAGVSAKETLYYQMYHSSVSFGLRRLTDTQNGSETASRNILFESSGSYYIRHQV